MISNGKLAQVGMEKSSRQSHLSPTLQHSIFSLFKRLSNKLGFLLDGYLISRNEHCQNGYSLSLEKPFKEVWNIW